MRIDGFTLIAQVVNFLVLVWLLKRLLYGRIVQAMNEREAKIAARLDEAARKRDEAEREADRYRTRNREIEEQRERILARTREEAETRRQQLTEEAKQNVERMQAQWFEALRQEKKQFIEDFREQLGQKIFVIARRALKDLANTELEQQMVSVFLERIREQEPSEREVFLDAIRASDQEVEFRSTFLVSAETKERVLRGLRDHFADDLVARFEVDPGLGCGIELHAHSHRLTWNLESYLEALEGEFFQGLEDKAMEHGKPRWERSGANQS